mgnify:CR=1 FL=1
MELTREQKIGIATKKRWTTDLAFREMMVRKAKERRHTKNSLRLMSKKQKARWKRIRKNPEAYKKMIENMSKNNAKNMLGRTKEKSNNWKGGKYIDKRDGYVIVTAPPNHPYVKIGGGGGTKTRYILEHRLIMEKILGRYLTPDEDVNHINGIKSDNRPENLIVVRHHAHYQEMKCPKCEFIFRTR